MIVFEWFGKGRKGQLKSEEDRRKSDELSSFLRSCGKRG